jgi:hypothetical protein
MGNYIGTEKNAFCVGRSKQPPAKMTLVLASHLNDRQHKCHLCWWSFKWPASTNGSVLAGRLPASIKGHFYWLKVAGGCRARQQKPVLAARTNRFWPSAGWRAWKMILFWAIQMHKLIMIIMSMTMKKGTCNWSLNAARTTKGSPARIWRFSKAQQLCANEQFRKSCSRDSS